jgi:hypothetical protein
MTLRDLLADTSASWERHPPAEPAVIASIAAALPAVPPDYLAFLALTDGGEGELGLDPGWFQLWPAAEVVELNAAYEIDAFLPGFIGFGSSGGGELLAFSPRGAVVRVPFIPMEESEAVDMALTFTDLVRAFGRVAPAI